MATTAQDKLVHLYYLGGLEGKNKATRVTADGRALALPRPGEYIEVAQRVADQLMKKHLYLANNGEYVGAFTLDGRIAQRVKQGQSVQDAYSMASGVSTTSVETLLEELARRGVNVEVVKKSDDEDDDKEPEKKPEEDNKASAKTVSKPGKAASKPEEKSPEKPTGLIGDLLNEDGDS